MRRGGVAGTGSRRRAVGGPVAAVLAAVAAVAGCARGNGQTADQVVPGSCGAALPVAFLPPELGEASGMTRDPRRDDLFWIHNDSGNEALLFGVDTTGAVVSRVRITGASDRDLEDVAVGRCGPDWCLYLGDIGDNLAAHPSIRVYEIPLPELPRDASQSTAAGAGGRPGPYDQVVTPRAAWDLVFPDGARDAEALLVDDAAGELLLVTKGREARVEMYAAGLAELADAAGATFTLRPMGDLRVPAGENTAQFITAGDISPDGRFLAIRSYISLYLLPWGEDSGRDPSVAPVAASLISAFEPQGEALTWSRDGTTVWLASEGRDGRPPQLSRIPCPPPEPAADPDPPARRNP
ncbi:MAG: hypothetical protein RRA92_02500 [Gemmatimonadota bacterium]|nr:hypothetical protein [Gemmatimonadota bacterium]